MTRSSLRTLALVLPSVFALACGGSDSSSSTGSGGAGGGTTTTGTGGTGGAGGGTAGSGGVGTACLDAADKAIATNGVMVDGGTKTIDNIVGECAMANAAMEPATKQCIEMESGLSKPCATCYDDTVACVLANCFAECAADPASAACQTCRDQKCTPQFHMCSGL